MESCLSERKHSKPPGFHTTTRELQPGLQKQHQNSTKNGGRVKKVPNFGCPVEGSSGGGPADGGPAEGLGSRARGLGFKFRAKVFGDNNRKRTKRT